VIAAPTLFYHPLKGIPLTGPPFPIRLPVVKINTHHPSGHHHSKVAPALTKPQRNVVPVGHTFAVGTKPGHLVLGARLKGDKASTTAKPKLSRL
jgi:hypothetical protein